MHGAAWLFPSLFAGSDRQKFGQRRRLPQGVRTRDRTHNGFGESRRVILTADRRLLARFDGTAGQWRINEGSYHVIVGKGANDLHLSADTKLAEALFGT